MNARGTLGRIRPGTAAAAAGIAVAAAWVLAPAFRGGWLWDDGLEVTGNPAVRSAAGWWRAWVAPAGMDYLPLKDTALWVQWRLWGADVAGYHAVNAALHAAAALLLWRLLAALGVRRGWIGGLLFAVHPAVVGSAAWISEFKNTLSLPLLLGAALAYVKSDLATAAGASRRLRITAFALFSLSLLAKSSGVMFPCVIVLYAWWRRGRVLRRDILAALPFAAASLAAGCVTLWFQGHRAIGPGGVLPPLGGRLAQAGWSVAAYAAECLGLEAPSPVYPPVRTHLPPVVPWLAVAALAAIAWRARSGWGRHVLLGGGWFLVNLAPVLGILPMAYLRVAPRADQFVYLPLVGVVGLAAAGWDSALSKTVGNAPARLAIRALAWGAAALAVAVLAVQARRYAAAFRGPEALWSMAIRRDPGAWLAYNNLGRVYLDRGRPDRAEPLLGEAVRLEPDSAEARANWGNALAGLGRGAEAEGQLEAAIRLDPRLAGAYYDLGALLEREGRYVEAAAEFRRTLALEPGDARAHNDLGLAWAHLGRAGQAAAEYAAALRLNPRMPEAWLNLGNSAFLAGRLDEAVDDYRRALALDPGYAAAHHNLGYALERLGRDGEARAELGQAARASPRRGPPPAAP